MADEWHELAAGELPRLQLEKLTAYGFRHEGDIYLYEEPLLEGAFLLLNCSRELRKAFTCHSLRKRQRRRGDE